MTRARAALCGLTALTALTGSACDLLVGDGEVTVLGNRGSVFAAQTPNAVRVGPGGTLVVEDADLFGRGQVVDGPPPDGVFPATGTAISANRGSVRIQKGRVAGGNALVMNVPPLPPGPPPIPSIAVQAGALTALRSSVEIEGGTLTSGSLLGVSAPYLPFPTLFLIRGRLRMSGGELGIGDTALSLSGGSTLLARFARVEISGGRLDAGIATLSASQARITGGSFGGGLWIVDSVVPPPVAPDDPPVPDGCTEIRGGAFTRIELMTASERLFIHGAEFDGLPLGPVTSPEFPGPSDDPGAFPAISVTGVFADGSPIDLDLVAPPGTQARLVSPDDPGCAFFGGTP